MGPPFMCTKIIGPRNRTLPKFYPIVLDADTTMNNLLSSSGGFDLQILNQNVLTCDTVVMVEFYSSIRLSI